MRVLIVTQHFPPDKSGNASRIYDLSINLSKLGVDVTVVSPHPSFPHGTFKRIWKLKTVKRVRNVKVVNLWSWQPTNRDPNFIERIAYYLIFPIIASVWTITNKDDYDIIITSAPPIFTGIPGLMAKKILNKAWIIEVRDLWLDAAISLGFVKKGSLFEKLTRIYEKACYFWSDLVGVTTRKLALDLISLYSVSKDKIKLVPNGVDTEYFRPFHTKKKKQIVYTGNVGHAQDLENVILAMEQVQKFNIKFLIVGDGDVKGHLEKLTERKNLTDAVIFTGLVPREKIPEIISRSFLGIANLKELESLEYAMPTKAYEYAACEIPVMGSGSRELSRFIRESGGGIFVRTNPQEIAEGILFLFENPKIRIKMGKKGRKFVKKHYDRKKIAKSLKNHIEVLINETADP